jgi:hypothetical protein
VWLLPFRKPVLDAAEHLRLAHWSGNDKMRGTKLQLGSTTISVRAASTNLSAAFIDGSEAWDHLQGVVISGSLAVPAGAASFGVVVNSSSSSGGCGKKPGPGVPPCDVGPDEGWDRAGNDEHCFSVNATYTAADCAAACEADPVCMAWTLVSAKTTATTSEAHEGLPCQRGLPLRAPFCTLKSPFPTLPIAKVATSTTGVPKRGLGQLTAHEISSLTAMLIDVAPAGDATRVWTMPPSGWPLSGAPAPRWLLDTSGPFECGTQGKPKTCGVATTVSVKPGRLPFLLYLRHGTLELYVQSQEQGSEELMLVQTTSYGKYPQARGAVGFVVQGVEGGAELNVNGLQAWAMNLKRMD